MFRLLIIYAEFLQYLKKEHNEDSLEFLLAVIEYHKFAIPFFSSPYEFDGSLEKELRKIVQPDNLIGLKSSHFQDVCAKMRKTCQDIYDEYIIPGSKSEMAITDKLRKLVKMELEDSNFHPDIWRLIFEHVSVSLRVNCLDKFIRSKTT